MKEQGHRGSHDHQIGHLDDEVGADHRCGRQLLEQRAADPGIEGGKGELEDGEEINVFRRRDLGYRHDMGGIEESADQGQAVSPGDGEVVGQGDQPHPRHAEHGGQNIVAVRALFYCDPVQKGHQNAVYRR